MRLGLKWSASPADHASGRILHGNIIGTLTGGIAHDFNNILTSVIAYTELATSDLDNKQELLEDLQNAHEAGNRAKDLLSQILAFSRQRE